MELLKQHQEQVLHVMLGLKVEYYYDSDDNNFYGCNSTDWVQLNN